MKTRSKKARRDITAAILAAAEDYFDFFYAAKSCPAALRRGGLIAARRVWAARTRRELLQRIHLLKCRKLILVQRTGDRLRCRLTSKGTAALMKRQILEAPRRTDGRIILVTFDVPEHRADDRAAFRRFLATAGFAQLHRSVWFSERDCAESLRAWIGGGSLGSWIRVFLAERA